MIAETLKIAIGMALALFIPGFMIVRMFFRELSITEQISFSVAFSIMIDIAIAIILGYDEAQALRTGGLTYQNIIILESFVIIVLLMTYGMMRLFAYKHRGRKRVIRWKERKK